MIYKSFVLIGWVLVATVPAAGQRRQQGETFDDAIIRVASTIGPRVEGRTVAVFEFPDLENRITNLSRMVSEQLTTELVRQTIGSARVLERRQVLQVLTELNLLRTDLTAEQVSQVGRQLGADAIVLGSATTLGSRVLVNARVVAVTGGELLAADRLSVEAPQELLALASAGIGGPSLTPAPKPQAGGSQPPAPGPPAPSASTQVEASPPAPRPQASFQRLSATVESCTRTRLGITCTLVFLNTSNEDGELMLMTESTWYNADGWTRVVAASGSSHNASCVRLANQRAGDYSHTTAVMDIPTPAMLEFELDGAEVTRIALLEVRGVWQNNAFVLRFRNVPLR
jgi:TolB-like protein